MILNTIIIGVILSSLVIGTTYVVFLKIMTKYHKTVDQVSIQELLMVLNAVIQTEFDLFDKDIFVNNRGITNSNFENYYNEISMHIIDSLSPVFFENMSKYMTQDAIITLVGRKVKEYLTLKVKNAK